MDISVVVPLYNEAESLPELAAWIERVMNEHGYTYEVLMINDGSTDESWKVIEHIDGLDPAYAPGTGTPEIAGLTPSQVRNSTSDTALG